MILSPLTFMLGSTHEIYCKVHYECEKKEQYFTIYTPRLSKNFPLKKLQNFVYVYKITADVRSIGV